MSGPWQEPNKRRGEYARYGLVIDWIKRLNNSQYGNPRFSVHFKDGTEHVTSSDASCSYGVENYESDRTLRGKPIDIVLTRAGRIVYTRSTETK
jgi:hypothetical protein